MRLAPLIVLAHVGQCFNHAQAEAVGGRPRHKKSLPMPELAGDRGRRSVNVTPDTLL
jgi:hypothetical protein